MGGREGQPVAGGRRVVFAPVVRHRLGGLKSENRQDHFLGAVRRRSTARKAAPLLSGQRVSGASSVPSAARRYRRPVAPPPLARHNHCRRSYPRAREG